MKWIPFLGIISLIENVSDESIEKEILISIYQGVCLGITLILILIILW